MSRRFFIIRPNTNNIIFANRYRFRVPSLTRNFFISPKKKKFYFKKQNKKSKKLLYMNKVKPNNIDRKFMKKGKINYNFFPSSTFLDPKQCGSGSETQ